MNVQIRRRTVTQCSEPFIDEMLNDPIVRALMAADGVDPRQLRRLLRSIAENLRVRRVENPQRTASRARISHAIPMEYAG
jgi:hypothetical protein